MAGTDSRQPIFVIGYQRSGTTLLQALLGAHPAIAAPPETFFTARVASVSDYFGDLSDDGNMERALHEALNPPLDLFAGCGFDHEALLGRALAGPRTYGGLLDAMLSDFAERQGKRRWSEKSPGQQIDAVYEMFPDAQVIHIVRDPRDVVASSLGAPFTALDAAGLARDWRALTLRTIRRGFEAGPARFLQIRYEDLARDPEATLRVVCAYLGESYVADMLGDLAGRRQTVPAVAGAWQSRALEPVTPAAEGRWKERLGAHERARVHAIVGPLLGALGYEAPGLRDWALALPMSGREAVAKVSRRMPRRRRVETPEERYLAIRSFQERQAARLRDAEQTRVAGAP